MFGPVSIKDMFMDMHGINISTDNSRFMSKGSSSDDSAANQSYTIHEFSLST